MASVRPGPSLSDATLVLLSDTVESIEDHGQEIVDTFRLKLAAKLPELAVFFSGGVSAIVAAADPNQIPAKSGKAPAEPDHPDFEYEYEYSCGGEEEWPLFVDEPLRATIEFSRHIDDIRLFHPVLERVAYRHISRDVGDVNYTHAGACLLSAITDVLGPDIATESVIAAWRQAIDALTAMLAATEAELREQIAATEGGFEGYKDFLIVDDILHANGSKTFTLQTAEGDTKPVPEHRGGQYISLEFSGKDAAAAMFATAKVSDISTDALCFTLFPTPEPAVRHAMRLVSGDTVRCSVPCGRFLVDAEDVEGMPDMVVAGRAEDVGMLVAVGKDLLGAGVEDVTVLVEGENNDGYVAVTLAEKFLKVAVVEYVSVEILLHMQPSGVLASPSLRDVVSELYEATEEDIYIKVIE